MSEYGEKTLLLFPRVQGDIFKCQDDNMFSLLCLCFNRKISQESRPDKKMLSMKVLCTDWLVDYIKLK